MVRAGLAHSLCCRNLDHRGWGLSLSFLQMVLFEVFLLALCRKPCLSLTLANYCKISASYSFPLQTFLVTCFGQGHLQPYIRQVCSLTYMSLGASGWMMSVAIRRTDISLQSMASVLSHSRFSDREASAHSDQVILCHSVPTATTAFCQGLEP